MCVFRISGFGKMVGREGAHRSKGLRGKHGNRSGYGRNAGYNGKDAADKAREWKDKLVTGKYTFVKETAIHDAAALRNAVRMAIELFNTPNDPKNETNNYAHYRNQIVGVLQKSLPHSGKGPDIWSEEVALSVCKEDESQGCKIGVIFGVDKGPKGFGSHRMSCKLRVLDDGFALDSLRTDIEVPRAEIDETRSKRARSAVSEDGARRVCQKLASAFTLDGAFPCVSVSKQFTMAIGELEALDIVAPKKRKTGAKVQADQADEPPKLCRQLTRCPSFFEIPLPICSRGRRNLGVRTCTHTTLHTKLHKLCTNMAWSLARTHIVSRKLI